MDLVAYIPLISAVAIYTARLIELKTKRDVIVGPVQECLSFRLFFVVGVIVWAGSVIDHLTHGPRLQPVWFLAGWVTALSSFWIRHQAIAALGRFWSIHVEIRESHQFVTSGPFRFIRHPCYLSMLLEVICVPLLLESLTMLIVAPILYLPALAYRLRLEEAALIEKFGDSYREYMHSTPAIFPVKWPRT